jgi:CubicO group peptidase (beta-lactamase class C family)
MTGTKKTLKYGALVILIAVLAAGVLYFNSLLPIITGYAAKNLCSAVFISERQPADVEELDLNFSFIKLNKNSVDYEQKSVTSRFLWGKSKAIYREGFGVTLVRDISEAELRNIKFPAGTEPAYSQDTIKWPLGNIVPDSVTGIDKAKLKEISRRVIDENAYNGHIFAFVVTHKGIPVEEAYKPGFNSSTKFISWSMAKSFVNAVTGIMSGKGMLDVNQPAGFKEWQNDDRGSITLNNLLQMKSGLEWNEDYGAKSDVTVMLHSVGDMGRYAVEKPLEYPAGTYWEYSSGTTNIVCDLLQEKFAAEDDYYAFVHKELFNRIGMPDAIMEVDASGGFVGSSYLYATARDYARFGLLYMNDGVFNGERILPEGWVEYSTSEVEGSDGRYGASFWLNRNSRVPSAPRDMFRCDGHDGQHIFMFPSQELVVVLLGYSPSAKGGIDLEKLLGDILGSVN